MKKAIFVIILIMFVVGGWLYFVKGYMGLRKRHAVPASLIYKAEIPGMKNIRIMEDPNKLKKMNIQELMDKYGLVRGWSQNPEINILAISGGGANGAYGAGILCGWTEAGNRPQFDIVTGVSTGALIAPAAFLGSDYDNVIRDIYTNTSSSNIAKRNIIEFLFNGRPSFLDTQPLRTVLKSAVTHEVVESVRREHMKGRRLYIATTNLDARRLVIWDMGAIASSGTPESEELFRQVMLASAAIPVAFPPVMIKVEADGRYYDEMHVDGSVTTQIIGPMLIKMHNEIGKKKTNIYIIRNGKLADVPSEVPYNVWDIASAAFTTLTTWQSYGDIYRFASLAKYKHTQLYFTCIPYEFNETRSNEFDILYMRKLFYRGYRSALSNGQWMEELSHRFKEVLKR